jgi:tRNA-dihydrouridine synthase B
MQTQSFFKLGDIEFNSKLIQAPLAGISCSAMRRLPWQFGGVAYTCTEMLSSHQLANKLDRSPRYFHIAADEGMVCFQISGDKADLLAKATAMAQEYGAKIIDLNVGCPKQKIRKKGYGSKLLSDSKKLSLLLAAICQEASCPITVKIRVDNKKDNYNSVVLDAINNSDVDAVIVHGRNWRDDYNTTVAYEEIRFFKDNSNKVVIANGDIFNSSDAQQLLHATKADALMIGRGAIGKPWIFQKIQQELAGAIFKPISMEQQITIFLQHINELAKLEDEHMACLQARRLVKHYFSDFGINPEQLRRLEQVNNLYEFTQLLRY